MPLQIPPKIVASMLDQLKHHHERKDIVQRMSDAGLVDINALANYRRSRKAKASARPAIAPRTAPRPKPIGFAKIDAARDRRQQWRDGAYTQMVQLAAEDPDILLQNEDRVEEVLHNAGKSVDDLSADIDKIANKRAKAHLEASYDQAHAEQIRMRLDRLRFPLSA